MFGHVTDIGGTKDSKSAREVYEEGLQIPPMKMFREGQISEDLMMLLAENVRGSDMADHITGDAGTNRLRGVDGDDRLVGLEGVLHPGYETIVCGSFHAA